MEAKTIGLILVLLGYSMIAYKARKLDFMDFTIVSLGAVLVFFGTSVALP